MKKRTIYIILFVFFSLIGNKLFSSAKAVLSIEITLIKHVTGCYGEQNAYINVIGINGTPDYIYTIDNWNTNNVTGEFSGLYAGTYTMKVRDADSNEAEISIEITQPEVYHLSGQKENVTGCFADDNASLSLTGHGGIEPYFYSINNGIKFYESGEFINLSAGYYEIIGKDKNNCQEILSLYIDEPEQITITSVWTTDVSTCYSDSNGTATVYSSGGTGSHSFSSDEINYQTENYFNALPQGSFVAYVKDENNCAAQRSFTINQPAELILDNVISSDLSCYHSKDGSIEIQAHGGTTPLSFTINKINYHSSNVFEDLSAGNYSTQVVDDNGCEISRNIVLREEDELLVSESHADVKCNNENTAWINLNASGGAGEYQYSINSGVDYQVENDFVDLYSDTYILVVKDRDNCTKNIEILINEPAPLIIESVISNDLRCNGDSDAEISIIAKGGNGTLFYSINAGTNLQNSNIFENLGAGYYPILVQDENFCQITNSATLDEPIFNVSYAKTDVDCFGNDNGTIGFNTYGSNPPFHFSIDEGATFQEVTMFIDLPGTSYNYVIKDQINCTKTGSFEILEPAALLIAEEVNSGCNNGDDISILMNAEGGKNPFQYSIDGGANFQSENLFSPLSIGTYILKTVDSNNCVSSKTINIETPDLLAVFSEIENLICNNDFTGSLKFSVEGGIFPYSFSIDNGLNFQTENIFTELQAADYSVIIKDNNNCQKSLSLNISEPEHLELTVETIEHITSCYGDANASFSISSLGGSGEILYNLDNGNYENTTSFFNLIAKDYLVNAKDINNCSVSLNLTITQPNLLVIDQIIKTDVPDCYGFNSGSLDIQVSGGSLPYVYSINSGDDFHYNSLFQGLGAGSYEISVRDASQCLVSSSISIFEPLELLVEYEKTDISCFGEHDGLLEFNARGGSGVLQYSINNGTNFSADFSFDFLDKGNYSLICKDQNGCAISAISTSIIEPQILAFASIEKTDLLCDRINGGIISAQASGGTGTILYSTNNLAQQTEGTFFDLQAGTHTLTVEDDNNCSLSADIELTQSGSNCIGIPTAFTPNEDGINDTWEIQHLELYPEAWVHVYDRFGNTITRYKAGETGWNGNFNYKRMPMASYWYRVKLSKDSKIIKGYFSLIR